MKLLAILKSINIRSAQAVPHVITAVQAAEALGTEATSTQKLVAVTGAVIETLGTSSNVTAQEVAATANMVVLVANLIGAFRKKEPTT